MRIYLDTSILEESLFWYEIKAVEHENIVDKISGKLRLKQEIIDELVDNEEAYDPEVF